MLNFLVAALWLARSLHRTLFLALPIFVDISRPAMLFCKPDRCSRKSLHVH